MAESKRRFNYDINQLFNLCYKFIENVMGTDCSAIFHDVKKQELERWLKFLESYDEYILDNTDGEDAKEDAVLRYEEACNKYQIIKKVILEKMQPTVVYVSAPLNTRHSLKLPACEIQTFEGGYFKWPAFRDVSGHNRKR